MARYHALHKPGEKAPEAGTFYCYTCSLRGDTSTCQVAAGQMFVACPKCVERNVADWDLAWKPEKHRPTKGRWRVPHLWPGSLGKRI